MSGVERGVARSAPGGGGPGARRPRLQILLIEDNPGDAMLVREVLAADGTADFEVALEERLAPALERLGGASYDIVLLDLNLPDSTGEATLDAVLRAVGAVPVVVLTGAGDDLAALAAVRRGAQDYLVKDRLADGGSTLGRVLLYAVERAQLQEQLAQSHADFAALIEQNVDGILAVDEDGRIRYANSAAGELLGTREHHLVGRDLGLPLVPGRWAEVELHGPDGDRRVAEMRSTATRWQAEHAHLVVLHDITERKRAEEELRASEERYRTLFETMAQGVVSQDASGAITDANPAAERILGLSLDQMQGRSSLDPRWRAVREDGSAYPGEEHPSMRALATGEPVLGGLLGVFNPVEDRIRWIGVDAIPQFRPGERRPFQVYATFVDVTERRESVERIQTLNRLLRTTSEINQMIVRERDNDRVVEEMCRIAVEHGDFSAACAARLDERDGTMRLVACAGNGQECAGCLRGVDPRTTAECGPLSTAAERGEAVVIQDVGAAATDYPEWAARAQARGLESAAALPVRRDGRIAGAFIVYSDRPSAITPEMADLLQEIAGDIGFSLEMIANERRRREAEERVRESEQRYRLLFERNLAGVYRTTLEGEIVECNDAFARIFGYESRESLIGRRARDTYSDAAERVRFVTALQEAGELRGYENVGVRADGSRVHLLENATLVRNGEDYVEGSVIDLTRHKEMEAQLRQAQKLEAVGQLAGGVAHDFNNLLQAGMGTAELLRLPGLDGERMRAVADELVGLFERGSALTRQLLLFARRQTTAPEPCELNQVVRNLSRMLRRLLKENVEIRLDLAHHPLELLADRGQLEQVIVNLALNAADAMPSGGTLTLRTGSGGARQVWLEVEDSGSGIPEEIRDRMFEPFFTTKAPGRGTGLGLAVVHGIVTSHRGEIRIDSTVGHGTSMRILLPAAAPEGRERVDSDGVPALALQGSGQPVLVVDDDDAVREGLCLMIDQLGYRVAGAATAEDALAHSTDERFDLLLSDIVLPGVSGAELARRLRAQWPDLRVVLMSGYSEDHALQGEIDTGRVRFLGKPFTLKSLAEVLRDELGASSEPSA